MPTFYTVYTIGGHTVAVPLKIPSGLSEADVKSLISDIAKGTDDGKVLVTDSKEFALGLDYEIFEQLRYDRAHPGVER